MQHVRAFGLAALLAVVASPTMAQSVPRGSDPAFLQTAISTLQAQRNRAMDEAASAEARLTKAQEEIADLQKQIAAEKGKAPPAATSAAPAASK